MNNLSLIVENEQAENISNIDEEEEKLKEKDIHLK
jgi:hypothetical protein